MTVAPASSATASAQLGAAAATARSGRPALSGACARRSRATGSWPTRGASRSESVQPASIDLRLGEHAWALRCSFLPDSDSTVEEKIKDLAFERIDLRDGATLERDRPYLVPLIEELRLPGGDPREGQPEELDRAPGRVHACAHRPQPPLRRDRGRLSRQALPGGRAAHVRDARKDGARAQPGAADGRGGAPERRASCSRSTRARRCCTWTRGRCRRPSCRSATGCS